MDWVHIMWSAITGNPTKESQMLRADLDATKERVSRIEAHLAMDAAVKALTEGKGQ